MRSKIVVVYAIMECDTAIRVAQSGCDLASNIFSAIIRVLVAETITYAFKSGATPPLI